MAGSTHIRIPVALYFRLQGELSRMRADDRADAKGRYYVDACDDWTLASVIARALDRHDRKRQRCRESKRRRRAATKATAT